MKKNGKTMIGLLIAFIIGISTTVGAATIFNSKDITYSSDKTTKKNVKEALDELYNKAGKCPDGWYCHTVPTTIADKVEIGDYISMTPTSTSYKPKPEDTGCMNDKNCTQNTINPSELNLWRVIKKNDNGTVEVVSEYVSSDFVRFRGKTGYKNFIGALNTIAAQYTNEKYVEKTRNIGYKNQIEYCTDYIEDICPKDNYESEDFALVTNVFGNLIATGKNDTKRRYWSSVRRFDKSGDGWTGLVGDDIGGTVDATCIHCGFMLYNMITLKEEEGASGIRPILTLKFSVEIASGDGKSKDTAYQLS